MNHAKPNETNMLDLTTLIANPDTALPFSYTFVPDPLWLGNNPYKFDGMGKIKGEVTFTESPIIQAAIIIPTEFVCSKCGEQFKENLFIEVNEVLLENSEDEHFSCVGNSVNLESIVSQLVATNIPSQALCNNNCKGVCAKCGTNLNINQCDCEHKAGANNPFASLKDKFN